MVNNGQWKEELAYRKSLGEAFDEELFGEWADRYGDDLGAGFLADALMRAMRQGAPTNALSAALGRDDTIEFAIIDALVEWPTALVARCRVECGQVPSYLDYLKERVKS